MVGGFLYFWFLVGFPIEYGIERSQKEVGQQPARDG
jgi:hypothetical protein